MARSDFPDGKLRVFPRRSLWSEGGGGWHKDSVSDCLPSAAPIGLSPLLILTLCGPERVLVVSTGPPDDLSCLTTPGVGCPRDGAVAHLRDIRVWGGGLVFNRSADALGAALTSPPGADVCPEMGQEGGAGAQHPHILRLQNPPTSHTVASPPTPMTPTTPAPQQRVPGGGGASLGTPFPHRIAQASPPTPMTPTTPAPQPMPVLQDDRRRRAGGDRARRVLSNYRCRAPSGSGHPRGRGMSSLPCHRQAVSRCNTAQRTQSGKPPSSLITLRPLLPHSDVQSAAEGSRFPVMPRGAPVNAGCATSVTGLPSDNSSVACRPPSVRHHRPSGDRKRTALDAQRRQATVKPSGPLNNRRGGPRDGLRGRAEEEGPGNRAPPVPLLTSFVGILFWIFLICFWNWTCTRDSFRSSSSSSTSRMRPPPGVKRLASASPKHCLGWRIQSAGEARGAPCGGASCCQRTAPT